MVEIVRRSSAAYAGTRYRGSDAITPLVVAQISGDLDGILDEQIEAISAALGEAMVLESSFSFLGVGVRPPIPSWGNMISDGLRVWQQYPHILAAPAMVLAAATIAFSFLGDGLNDALNPRQWK